MSFTKNNNIIKSNIIDENFFIKNNLNIQTIYNTNFKIIINTLSNKIYQLINLIRQKKFSSNNIFIISLLEKIIIYNENLSNEIELIEKSNTQFNIDVEEKLKTILLISLKYILKIEQNLNEPKLNSFLLDIKEYQIELINEVSKMFQINIKLIATKFQNNIQLPNNQILSIIKQLNQKLQNQNDNRLLIIIKNINILEQYVLCKLQKLLNNNINFNIKKTLQLKLNQILEYIINLRKFKLSLEVDNLIKEFLNYHFNLTKLTKLIFENAKTIENFPNNNKCYLIEKIQAKNLTLQLIKKIKNVILEIQKNKNTYEYFLETFPKFNENINKIENFLNENNKLNINLIKKIQIKLQNQNNIIKVKNNEKLNEIKNLLILLFNYINKLDESSNKLSVIKNYSNITDLSTKTSKNINFNTKTFFINKYSTKPQNIINKLQTTTPESDNLKNYQSPKLIKKKQIKNIIKPTYYTEFTKSINSTQKTPKKATITKSFYSKYVDVLKNNILNNLKKIISLINQNVRNDLKNETLKLIKFINNIYLLENNLFIKLKKLSTIKHLTLTINMQKKIKKDLFKPLKEINSLQQQFLSPKLQNLIQILEDYHVKLIQIITNNLNIEIKISKIVKTQKIYVPIQKISQKIIKLTDLINKMKPSNEKNKVKKLIEFIHSQEKVITEQIQNILKKKQQEKTNNKKSLKLILESSLEKIKELEKLPTTLQIKEEIEILEKYYIDLIEESLKINSNVIIKTKKIIISDTLKNFNIQYKKIIKKVEILIELAEKNYSMEHKKDIINIVKNLKKNEKSLFDLILIVLKQKTIKLTSELEQKFKILLMRPLEDIHNLEELLLTNEMRQIVEIIEQYQIELIKMISQVLSLEINVKTIKKIKKVKVPVSEIMQTSKNLIILANDLESNVQKNDIIKITKKIFNIEQILVYKLKTITEMKKIIFTPEIRQDMEIKLSESLSNINKLIKMNITDEMKAMVKLLRNYHKILIKISSNILNVEVEEIQQKVRVIILPKSFKISNLPLKSILQAIKSLLTIVEEIEIKKQKEKIIQILTNIDMQEKKLLEIFQNVFKTNKVQLTEKIEQTLQKNLLQPLNELSKLSGIPLSIEIYNLAQSIQQYHIQIVKTISDICKLGIHLKQEQPAKKIKLPLDLIIDAFKKIILLIQDLNSSEKPAELDDLLNSVAQQIETIIKEFQNIIGTDSNEITIQIQQNMQKKIKKVVENLLKLKQLVSSNKIKKLLNLLQNYFIDLINGLLQLSQNKQ